MMKILLYNWVPFNNPARGGGVTAYLKNLIDEFQNTYQEHIVYFLCSGVYYDVHDRSLRYEQLQLKDTGNCQCYAIINSPVFSPAYLSFFTINQVIENDELRVLFEQFLDEHGPFDVVHFHNIEGLSVNVLKSKRHFSKTKYCYSMHNYYALCPQVNFWKHERICCDMGDTGRQCLGCMIDHVPAEKLRQKMSMTYDLIKNYSPEREAHYLAIGKELDEKYRAEEKRDLTQYEIAMLENYLSLYRKEIISALNDNIDMILAVSGRVKDIAVKCGVNENKIKVSYIGTRAADNAKVSCNETSSEVPISMIYLGYQRRDKGFFFLVDILEAMDAETASKINLTIAAKGNEESQKKWRIDGKKFHSYTFQNGYKREELEELLCDKNLGIVPVLWEDNLPQVAIEMAAHGVPVLSSDLGGARELCSDPIFSFPAGDIDICLDRIRMFTQHPEILQTYYQSFNGLTTMRSHLNELLKLYEE